MSNAASSAMAGRVFGGQQPITGATITVWQMGTSGYGTGATQLATTTTNSDGNFAFAASAYTCTYDNAPVYVTSQGGNTGAGVNANAVLAAAIGTCGSAHDQTLVINEVTTAAMAFALGQFFNPTIGGAPTSDTFGGPAAGAGTYNVGLVAASNITVPMLVQNRSGMAYGSSDTRTLETAKLYSIANTLAACVNSTGQTSSTDSTSLCGRLFDDTTPPNGNRPADTLQAAVLMSLYPYQNVTNLFTLSNATPPFSGLPTPPNDWTLAVAYTAPNLGLSIFGTSSTRTSSNIDIDAAGKVWFPTNTAASHGVAYFDPASGTFNGPFSTGLLDPQYVAVDRTGTVWATDLASSQLAANATANPTALGTSYAVAASAAGGPLVVDHDNAVLFAYTTTAGVHNLGAELSGSVSVDNTDAFLGTPSGLITIADGTAGNRIVNAITSGAGGGCAEEQSVSGLNQYTLFTSGGACASGGIAAAAGKFDLLMSATTINQIGSDGAQDFFSPPPSVNQPEGIATDGNGVIWIANAGEASVGILGYQTQSYTDSDYYSISPVTYLHDSTHGGTMTAPYGIALDGSGNVWLSNAGCVSTSTAACTPGAFVLTELIGAAAPTVTPLSLQGDNVGTRPTH